jgi:hypothetical protein
MPSLWRNGIRLGDIFVPGKASSDPAAISGMLRPTPAFAGIEPMVQSRMPHVTRRADVPGCDRAFHLRDRPRLRQQPEAQALEKELLPMSEEEVRGVPPEKLLEIRDDEGRTVQCNFLVLSCFVVPPDELEEAEKHLGPGTREVWMVMASHSR